MTTEHENKKKLTDVGVRAILETVHRHLPEMSDVQLSQFQQLVARTIDYRNAIEDIDVEAKPTDDIKNKSPSVIAPRLFILTLKAAI